VAAAEKEVETPTYEWRNKDYWSLPENVRAAVDKAKEKKRQSDFYYRLADVNDKIQIFTEVFYNRIPSY